MKSRIITGVLCILTVIFLFATLGHAQIAGSSIQPATGPTYSVPDHPQHAEQHELRSEQSLLGSNGVTVARGERPLSDFPGNDKPAKSLGEVAREYRALKIMQAVVLLPDGQVVDFSQRATRVWNQQGR
jgi:hypothetical protein